MSIMQRVRFLLVSFSIVFLLSGCLWFSHGRKEDKPLVISPRSDVSVEVLNEGEFQNGGSLVFIPFTVGAGAEAGPMMDRLSLMIVKGASDFLEASRGSLRIITGENVDAADFVLEGHVEEFDVASKLKSFGIGKKKFSLKIKAEIRKKDTNEVIALIAGYKSFKRSKDADQAAYDIGRGIAEGLAIPRRGL